MTTPPVAVSASHPHNFTQLKCSPSTLICREKTVILGDVTIGPECVIHPATTIIARNGPIVIGSNNLIEERVNIINDGPGTMMIGDHNVFEVDSHIQAPLIGNHNILEAKSLVGRNIELTNNCIIGAGCKLYPPSLQDSSEIDSLRFQPYTVISGSELTRRTVPNLPASSHGSQLDFLRKILPNYQKLWRAANLPATPPQNTK